MIARLRIFLTLGLGLMFMASSLHAQNGIIKGRVINDLSNEALEYATVFLQNTTQGAYTDAEGAFEIKGLEPGLYNLEVRYTGFGTQVLYEVEVTNSRPYIVEIRMKIEEAATLDSVIIVASPFKRTKEAPLSLQSIGKEEIQRNPGGNRDISKVIQSLPGVNTSLSFRNDILIRGGGPGENRFYLDDIEVPNINHFASQGASGGPVGLINVDFIQEVDFYSGAFPATRGNALSSVFQFTQREARDDRIGFRATVGASDLALTVEGPYSKRSQFMFSARRSYLQLLFKLIGLPFLPTYNDFQYRQKIKLNDRNEITIIGLGAIDQFALNLEADSTDFQRYILGNIPVNTQWNYTVGARYRHYGDNGYWTVVGSRNMINYRAYKYENNDESSEDNKILDYVSQESENKLRVEHTSLKAGYKITYGISLEHARYTNSTFNRLPFGTINYEAKINLLKYGAFAQVGKSYLKDDRLTLSLGARIDGMNYSKETANPFKQFSPRFSASFAATPQLSFNFNTGMYFQTPPYTVLGYKDTETGEFVNKANGIKYINNKHAVAGVSYITESNTKVSVEGFYKKYDNYPLLLRDSVSLANVGADFGVFGNEPAIPTSEGRTYGMEVLVQQRLFKGFYGIVAYTLSWSQFTDQNGNFAPSSWDNRHIISLTGGKKFKRNWELGMKWRFQSGTPYTPADVATSSQTFVWDLLGQAILDYGQVNSQRTPSYHQLDMRIDKKWFFKSWSFNLYFDMQNVYNFKGSGAPFLDVVRDENGSPVVDTADPTRYQMRLINNEVGVLQPTIGIVVEY